MVEMDDRLFSNDGSLKVNDADRCRRTPLQWAISCKNSECIEMLLAAKASATRKGPKGLTAFHLACRQVFACNGARTFPTVRCLDLTTGLAQHRDPHAGIT